jgi:hypothetical protein
MKDENIEKGRGNYSQAKSNAKRLLKQKQAEIRQAKYNALTLSEKVALVEKRGGSKRELARLTAPKKEKVVVQTPPTPAPVAPPIVEKKEKKYSDKKYRKAKKD